MCKDSLLKNLHGAEQGLIKYGKHNLLFHFALPGPDRGREGRATTALLPPWGWISHRVILSPTT